MNDQSLFNLLKIQLRQVEMLFQINLDLQPIFVFQIQYRILHWMKRFKQN